jgi:hypothetical protein
VARQEALQDDILRDLGAELSDFADAAAIISRLDVAVSVDTASRISQAASANPW